MHTALRRAAALAVTAAVSGPLVALSGGTAAAAPKPGSAHHVTRQAAASTALVRGAHFSPNTPGVDVYLTAYSGGHSVFWLSNVGYGDVSPYRRLKPGPYIVSMRAHGAKASSPAALSWTLNARAGGAYTVAAVGENAKLRGIVRPARLRPPKANTGLVRVFPAASRAPHATLVAGTDTVASDAAFASYTGYASVPAGTWTVEAKSVPTASPSTQSRVAIKSSGVYSLIVLDAKQSGIVLRVIRDAAGSTLAPRGAIDAGGGGTATQRIGTAAVDTASSRGQWAAVAGALLGVCALLLTGVGLQRRRG